MEELKADEVQLQALTSVAGITQRILTQLPLLDIYQYLCKELVQTMNYPVAYVALKEDDGSARIVAHCGLTEEEIKFFEMGWDHIKQGKDGFGKVIRSESPQLRSIAIFPISSSDSTFRILTLYSLREDYFDATRVKRLQSLVDQLRLVNWVDEGHRKLCLQNAALASDDHAILIMDGKGKIVWVDGLVLIP